MAEFSDYLSKLKNADISLDHDARFKFLLREAGDDPIMRKTQDDFFDRMFWDPTVKSAEYLPVEKPLSYAIIYDSKVQGSYYNIRGRTNKKYGVVKDIGEKKWVNAYLTERKNWLYSYSPTLRKTIYRMDALLSLVHTSNWDLTLPFHIRGNYFDERLFSEEEQRPVVITAEPTDKESGVDLRTIGDRMLRLLYPPMKGVDILWLQKFLGGFGNKPVHGFYDDYTSDLVKKFQKAQGLKPDGMVGPNTWAMLDKLANGVGGDIR